MLKIHSIEYHRNGICGNPFYTVECSSMKSNFVATFETLSTNENEIKIKSCRVLQIDKVADRWRGDEFAVDIEKRLHYLQTKKKKNSFYDLIGCRLDRILTRKN